MGELSRDFELLPKGVFTANVWARGPRTRGHAATWGVGLSARGPDGRYNPASASLGAKEIETLLDSLSQCRSLLAHLRETPPAFGRYSTDVPSPRGLSLAVHHDGEGYLLLGLSSSTYTFHHRITELEIYEWIIQLEKAKEWGPRAVRELESLAQLK